MTKLQFAAVVVVCFTGIAGAIITGKGAVSCAVSCVGADWKWSALPNNYGDATAYYCSCQKAVTP